MSPAPKNRRTAGKAMAANGQLKSLDFVRASLECLQTNIFVADTAFNIIYANDRAVSWQLRDRFPYPYERTHGTAFLARITASRSGGVGHRAG